MITIVTIIRSLTIAADSGIIDVPDFPQYDLEDESIETSTERKVRLMYYFI